MRGFITRALQRLFGSPAADAPHGGAGNERVCLAAGEGMGEKYSLALAEVFPRPHALLEADARHLLAEGLLKPSHEQGPTRVGVTIGCDEKTVRSARDERTTMRLDLAFNLLLVDDHVLDPLLAHFGKALVDRDPRPVDWRELGAAAADLSAGIHRALAKGHVSHLDQPGLKALARRVLALGQGAA